MPVHLRKGALCRLEVPTHHGIAVIQIHDVLGAFHRLQRVGGAHHGCQSLRHKSANGPRLSESSALGTTAGAACAAPRTRRLANKNPPSRSSDIATDGRTTGTFPLHVFMLFHCCGDRPRPCLTAACCPEGSSFQLLSLHGVAPPFQVLSLHPSNSLARRCAGAIADHGSRDAHQRDPQLAKRASARNSPRRRTART